MRVLSISTGLVAPILGMPEGHPQRLVSGIRKQAVSTLLDPRPITVKPLGLEGDEQADLTVHGGLDKALYLYPAEHYPFWNTVCGQANRVLPPEGLAHGSLGENLTTEGLLETRHILGGDIVLSRIAPRGRFIEIEALVQFS